MRRCAVSACRGAAGATPACLAPGAELTAGAATCAVELAPSAGACGGVSAEIADLLFATSSSSSNEVWFGVVARAGVFVVRLWVGGAGGDII